MLPSILDILYPVRCPVCGEIVVPRERLVCSRCEGKLQVITEPRCKKCSKPIGQEEQEYCSDCERKEYHFIKGYSVWVYDAVMKKSIAGFKYQNKKEYARYYIRELVRFYGKTIAKLSPDVLVPVPLHKNKLKERGYNQADVLAKGIGRQLHIPVLSELIIRTKMTMPQKQLSDKERLKNLKQAFRINRKAAEQFPKKLQTVLLVDDIYTTGSTIEACTNVLMEYGIIKIYFITLCIGKGF